MSYQAMSWAIEQNVGSPSARCVLMSIANYANTEWCAWPKQETIAKESVQSVDSVQRRMPELIGKNLIRRIKLKRFGRRTHDFYILPRSPLFVAELEEIRPYLPASCDVIEEIENAAANCGSVQAAVPYLSLPQSALHATATVRQLEPVIEPRKNPQPQTPSPSGEGALKKVQDDSEFEQCWSRFRAAGYPDGIIDVEAARRDMRKCSPERQEAGIAGVAVYADYLRRRKQKSKAAHLYWRKGLWEGLSASQAAQSAGPSLHHPNSEVGRALDNLGTIARCRPMQHAGGISYRGEITPRLRAMASVPPESEWVEYSHGSPNYRAWFDFIRETFSGRAIPLREAYRAPWPWPPSSEGKIYSATDPPQSSMADDDAAFMAENGLG